MLQKIEKLPINRVNFNIAQYSTVSELIVFQPFDLYYSILQSLAYTSQMHFNAAAKTVLLNFFILTPEHSNVAIESITCNRQLGVHCQRSMLASLSQVKNILFIVDLTVTLIVAIKVELRHL